MPKRLLLALVILVAAPLVLLGWLSAKTIATQESVARQSIDDLFQNQLVKFDNSCDKVFEGYEEDFRIAVASANGSIQPLQELPQQNPVVRAVLVVDARGNLLYPPPSTDRFLDSIASARPSIAESKPMKMKGFGKTSKSFESIKTPHSAWQTWYMDEGMQLIHWQVGPRPSMSVGVLLERSRWIADLTAALPDSNSAKRAYFRSSRFGSKSVSKGVSRGVMIQQGFTALVDEQDRVIYRWGDNSSRRQDAIATRSLLPPVANWKLEFHADDPLPAYSFLPTLLSLSGVGVLLLSLGGYVLTSVRRKINEAQNRVSFASQVSHELRTPLTNIRLYAELAESDLDRLPTGDNKTSLAKRLTVIDSESRRLGRLVSGVLEVIREGGKERLIRLKRTFSHGASRESIRNTRDHVCRMIVVGPF